MVFSYFLLRIFKLRVALSKMATQLEQTTNSIIGELKLIQENKEQRNEVYEKCMNSYLNHLKKEITQIQSTTESSTRRNNQISEAFQTVYEKILTSSQITLRKIKQTSFEKKKFWDDLIKNNADMYEFDKGFRSDLELKREFYQQKRDSEDRYAEAIEQQKVKKVPYSVLLGKNKKAEDLREWQQKNRKFEEKVNKGTATLNQWRSVWNMTAPELDEPTNAFQGSGYNTAYNNVNLIENTVGLVNEKNELKLSEGVKNNGLYYNTVKSTRDEPDFLKSFEKKR